MNIKDTKGIKLAKGDRLYALLLQYRDGKWGFHFDSTYIAFSKHREALAARRDYLSHRYSYWFKKPKQIKVVCIEL